MLTIKNIHNGAESPMTKKQWEKIKDDPMYKGIFEVVEDKPTPEAPPEVKELEQKQATIKKSKSVKQTETPGTETQAE